MFALVYLFVAAQAAAVTTDDMGNHPVSKVVALLKDMQTQLAKEGEEDQEVYEKITCWCKTNDADKSKSISGAEARITDLSSTIEEETASSSRLNTEIKNLEHEISANNAAMEKATALRTKELAEFNSEEKDLLQSIGAMKSAVTVLGKHNSFIQVARDPNALVNMAVMLQDQFRKNADIVSQIATPSQRQAVADFAKAPNDFFDGALIQTKQAPSAGSYAPASGAIFGILSQMKETFETNLANSQKEEQSNVAAYNDLKKAKQTEISAGENQRDAKTQELANSQSALAEAKQDLEDTRNSLSADQKFLANLKETCANTESEYDARTKTRQEEIVACGEALSILNSDDARDTFSSTFNAFVQVESDSRREQVANILSSAGKKFNNHNLSALAMSARNEAFAKLLVDIDGMIEGLNNEKADDQKMKGFCIEEISKNERAQTLKTRDIKKSEAKVNNLESQIAELTKAIDTLNREVTEMNTQMKRSGEDREMENSDFQTVIADQRATQKLLTSALDVLKGVYEKKSLLQTSQPAGFKTYEKQGGAGGVLGMLQQIISEAKALEGEAIKDEADAQKAYENFVKDTNKSLEQKNRDLINKSAAKAQAEADLVATQEALEAQNTEQTHNGQENTDLHNSCDFTLKNFDMRQEALSQEMESLRQAKSILSGSSAGFLQKY